MPTGADRPGGIPPAGKSESRCLRELGLPARASWEQIQTRYRQLALDLHPDRNRSADAGERFRRVTAAYAQLSALYAARRTHCRESLARLYDDPKVREMPLEELALRMRHSSSADVRTAVAFLLGTRAGGECRRLLLEAARDRDAAVGALALKGLAEVGRPGDLLRCLPLAHRSLAGCFLAALARAWLRSLTGLPAGLKRVPARKAGTGNKEGECNRL